MKDPWPHTSLGRTGPGLVEVALRSAVTLDPGSSMETVHGSFLQDNSALIQVLKDTFQLTWKPGGVLIFSKQFSRHSKK